jgi:hypothetical protein
MTLNLDMLQNWLAPKLDNLGIKDNGHAHGVSIILVSFTGNVGLAGCHQ